MVTEAIILDDFSLAHYFDTFLLRGTNDNRPCEQVFYGLCGYVVASPLYYEVASDPFSC